MESNTLCQPAMISYLLPIIRFARKFNEYNLTSDEIWCEVLKPAFDLKEKRGYSVPVYEEASDDAKRAAKLFSPYTPYDCEDPDALFNNLIRDSKWREGAPIPFNESLYQEVREIYIRAIRFYYMRWTFIFPRDEILDSVPVWMHTDIEKTLRERALKRWTGNANGADNYIKDSLNAHGMTIPNLYQENIDAYPRDWLQKL